ncbi:magnesium transporter [Komagataeibacter rhaeticus]|uniref:Magnesium transporter CorA family protein n=1 Tax=Komagataeibacter rhaeticus TaxID=215221 RepID=A0A181C6C4_9PROT|nr:magnesium transporter CorA family protein [Komagataeibacter rhaeticus]ATU73977.1 magnesium transporter [Komagataeibacter xylinus]KDU97524.1 magnesium transporter [Komagataeibacter rhaeticus AF1]MBL7239042.1 magnesium transporter CorA family protein [Komagataeibacter rhaeticus]PYD54944.1 magnesium transporter [Komagataeibacter rhaeticus]QIP34134.1 magnesium transporter CorA family protein [Komagataeibacter rhaeticus]
MFLAHRPGAPARTVSTAADGAGAAWLDLLNPTPEEEALAAQVTGLRIPTRSQLDEIESSSRLFMEGDAVYLSTPLVRKTPDDFFVSPVGFVLMHERLLTVRYTGFSAFDVVARQVATQTTPLGANEAGILLLEAVVDRLADILEHLGQALDGMSRDVFQSEQPGQAQAGTLLRNMLRRVGRSGDLGSSVRDSLLGLERIAIFLGENKRHDLSERLQARLGTVERDIRSLNDFVSQTANKVQFLLDATLGFISIEQNNGMKILTVVSFIGVAPTLVAGIYGMNFHDIPELNWKYGYWYSLVLMAATVVLPLLWFWRRGWLGRNQ